MNEVLPHGRSLAEIHRAAQAAARYTVADAVSYPDRYDEAWSAIVETLYTGRESPSDWEMMQSGRAAIFDIVRQHKHHHGFDSHSAGSAPMFQRYWNPSPHPSHEAAVVAKVATAQILPRLTDRHRQVIGALAATQDYESAAQLVNMPRCRFISVLSAARRQFRVLWHEGETPSGVWRQHSPRAADEEWVDGGTRERCRNGHVMSATNTYVDHRSEERFCRRCRAANSARYRRSRSTRAKASVQ